MTRTQRVGLSAVAAVVIAVACATVISGGATAATPTGQPTKIQPAAGPTCTDPRSNVTRNATVVGTSGPDVIWARAGDVIATLAGDDTVFSDQAGPDVLVCLGDGADFFGPSAVAGPVAGGFAVLGEGGRDMLMGGDGADYLVGGAGADIHYGGSGTDIGDPGPDIDVCSVEVDVTGTCEYRSP